MHFGSLLHETLAVPDQIGGGESRNCSNQTLRCADERAGRAKNIADVDGSAKCRCAKRWQRRGDDIAGTKEQRQGQKGQKEGRAHQQLHERSITSLMYLWMSSARYGS